MVPRAKLSDRQIRKIAKNFEGEFAPRDKCLFVLRMAAECHLIELLALTIGDVYHNGKLADFLSFNQGGTVPRVVPINRDVKRVIQALIDWHLDRYENVGLQRPLFPSRNGRGSVAMTLQRANKVLKEACMAARLNDKTPNRLLFIRVFLINLLKLARWVKFFLDCV